MLQQRPFDEPPTLQAYVRTLQELHFTKQRLPDVLIAWRKVATGQVALLINLHLELTRAHVVRLDRILQRVGVALRHTSCPIADDLLRDADRAVQASDQDHRNGALLNAAYRVQWTQIRQYESVCALARALGDTHAQQELESALAEERGMQYVAQSMATRTDVAGLIA